MVDITLRNIPLKLQEVLRRRADTEGLSLDNTVIRMLEEAAGQRTAAGRHPHDDLDHLAGTWSEEEAAAFEAALLEQRIAAVDAEGWDRQFEADVEAGKLDALAKRVLDAHAEERLTKA
ncbi:MAG TPA: hypothetical protein VGC93_14135 [Thermoanaerobaculia bacterium]